MNFFGVKHQMPAGYAAEVPRAVRSSTEFSTRLAVLRREKGLTQMQLAERIKVHVQQLKRYEAGSSQPTLEVIRKLALALGVSADALLFGESGRGPDEELRLQFEAVSRFSPEEKNLVRSLLDSIILTHEARRWSAPAPSGGTGERNGR